MQLRRKVVTAMLSVTCAIGLAACGQQVVAHVKAADSVQAGLTSVFNGPTSRFVITAQGLPGSAALADGSFSIVITTSKGPSTKTGAMEVSVLHETTDLADLLAVSGSTYLRVDLKDIVSLSGNPAEFATISTALSQVAARPNLGYLNDIVAGKWVGVAASTYQAMMSKYLKAFSGLSKTLSGLPSAPAMMPSYLKNLEKLLQDPKKLNELKLTVRSSFLQSFNTWLSIHQKTAGEYSLALPVRSFVSSLFNKLMKPLESYLSGLKAVSKAQLSQALNSIPAGLSLQANVWISNGSLTKIQAFIPQSTAYLMIGVSHPPTPVTAPSGATMLTMANLTALSGLSGMAAGLGGAMGGLGALGGMSSISGV